MCGLPVINRDVFWHSRETYCKHLQSSGRCFGKGSARAPIHINPRRRDERDLSSMEFQGAAVPDYQLLSSLSQKASFHPFRHPSAPAPSSFKRAANTSVVDCFYEHGSPSTDKRRPHCYPQLNPILYLLQES